MVEIRAHIEVRAKNKLRAAAASSHGMIHTTSSFGDEPWKSPDCEQSPARPRASDSRGSRFCARNTGWTPAVARSRHKTMNPGASCVDNTLLVRDAKGAKGRLRSFDLRLIQVNPTLTNINAIQNELNVILNSLSNRSFHFSVNESIDMSALGTRFLGRLAAGKMQPRILRIAPQEDAFIFARLCGWQRGMMQLLES